ncbi:MAG: branched-chain amino acid ABC transporter permease [Thermoleophilia bacterium]
MSGTPAAARGDAARGLSVERGTTLSRVFAVGASLLVAGLVFVPLLGDANMTQKLTALLILVMISTMWNALAGYGGLVSVGQQAYIGVGAYGTIWMTHHGVPPYHAMFLAILVSGAVAVVFSFLLLRLRAGQFAIATWVVAAVFSVVVSLDKGLGAGTGVSLIELNQYTVEQRQSFTYWFTLGAVAALLFGLFFLLRSRMGASLQAIRDDEEAAASVGVRVMLGKRVLYVFAGLGFGAAGAMTLANTTFIQPASAFAVSWTAFAIFMVLVGGLGTFEGPIIGAVLLFLIQDWFADLGVWYMIGLGSVAILFALLMPRGLWGTIEGRTGIQLIPVGYRVWASGKQTGGVLDSLDLPDDLDPALEPSAVLEPNTLPPDPV